MAAGCWRPPSSSVSAGWRSASWSAPLRQLLARSRIDPSAASFLANSARSALWVVVALGVLHQLGVETASLLTLVGGAGGGSVAAGLAGQLRRRYLALVVPPGPRRRPGGDGRPPRPGHGDPTLPRHPDHAGQPARDRAQHAVDQQPVPQPLRPADAAHAVDPDPGPAG